MNGAGHTGPERRPAPAPAAKAPLRGTPAPAADVRAEGDADDLASWEESRAVTRRDAPRSRLRQRVTRSPLVNGSSVTGARDRARGGTHVGLEQTGRSVPRDRSRGGWLREEDRHGAAIHGGEPAGGFGYGRGLRRGRRPRSARRGSLRHPPGRAGCGVRVPGGATGFDATPSWTMVGDDNFGSQVAAVGDVDGDGRTDFAVAAINGDGPEASLSGSVTVYRGGTSGQILAKLGGEQALDKFGASVTGGCDLDADGSPDLVVGATGHSPGPGELPGWCLLRLLRPRALRGDAAEDPRNPLHGHPRLRLGLRGRERRRGGRPGGLRHLDAWVIGTPRRSWCSTEGRDSRPIPMPPT